MCTAKTAPDGWLRPDSTKQENTLFAFRESAASDGHAPTLWSFTPPMHTSPFRGVVGFGSELLPDTMPRPMYEHMGYTVIHPCLVRHGHLASKQRRRVRHGHLASKQRRRVAVELGRAGGRLRSCLAWPVGSESAHASRASRIRGMPIRGRRPRPFLKL
jgi:hypothetical protein